MSTKVDDASVSAKIKDERVTVYVRRSYVYSLQFWASDFPYDEHIIEQKNWMAMQMETSHGKDAPLDLSEVTPTGWRIVEAAVKEANIVLANS